MGQVPLGSHRMDRCLYASTAHNKHRHWTGPATSQNYSYNKSQQDVDCLLADTQHN